MNGPPAYTATTRNPDSTSGASTKDTREDESESNFSSNTVGLTANAKNPGCARAMSNSPGRGERSFTTEITKDSVRSLVAAGMRSHRISGPPFEACLRSSRFEGAPITRTMSALTRTGGPASARDVSVEEAHDSDRRAGQQKPRLAPSRQFRDRDVTIERGELSRDGCHESLPLFHIFEPTSGANRDAIREVPLFFCVAEEPRAR